MTATRRVFVVLFTVSVGLLLGAATPASAQTDVERTYVGVTPPAIGQIAVTPPGQGPVVVNATPAPILPFQVSSSPPAAVPEARVSGLAFTGADILGLTLFGLLALIVGVALTRRARRHPAEQS
jgi:hypothetical protein